MGRILIDCFLLADMENADPENYRIQVRAALAATFF
jgi:hypothetical protein